MEMWLDKIWELSPTFMLLSYSDLPVRRQRGAIYRLDDGSKERRHQTATSVFILTLFANECVH